MRITVTDISQSELSPRLRHNKVRYLYISNSYHQQDGMCHFYSTYILTKLWDSIIDFLSQ